MKMRVESADPATTEQVQRLLRYAGVAIQPYVAEASVRVNEQTDERDNALVRCRVQLNQLDGKLISVEELQPTLELAVTRAFERAVRTAKRRQRLRNQRWS